MTTNHENVGELPTMLEEIYMSGLMDDHIERFVASFIVHLHVKHLNYEGQDGELFRLWIYFALSVIEQLHELQQIVPL